MENLRLKAQILAMRFASRSCWRPFATSDKSYFYTYSHPYTQKRKRLIIVALALESIKDSSAGKLQDGFTVLLMTETKFGIILTLENNTNPFELLGNCRSCQENWMNRGHEKTRLCLEHENKITFYLLFHCS